MITLTLHRAKAIYGWMSDAELQLLAELASKAKVIFEIGSYHGKSTRALGDNTEGTVYAIDPWNYIDPGFNTGLGVNFTVSEVDFANFLRNLDDLIRTNKVKPVRSTWENWDPDFGADLIFVDGDHRFEPCYHDIRKAIFFCNSPGVICGHDYHLPGVKLAVHTCFKDKQINVVDTIWSVEV